MMSSTSLAALTALLITLAPSFVAAQPRWDLAGTAGLLAGHSSREPDVQYRDDWFHTAQAGGIVGAHLTRQLKLEVDLAVSGRGRQYIQRLVMVPGIPTPYYVSSETETSVGTFGTSLVWQFRDNEWVHPFVRAGAVLEVDRQRERTFQQFFYPVGPRAGEPPIVIAREQVDDSTISRARLLLGGGAKVYVTPRAFVRTEGVVTLDGARQNVALRIGVGVDF